MRDDIREAFAEMTVAMLKLMRVVDEHLPNDARDAVRLGEWEEVKDGAGWNGVTEDGEMVTLPTKVCSECGKPVAIVSWDHYCPNCGAKMGGVKEQIQRKMDELRKHMIDEDNVETLAKLMNEYAKLKKELKKFEEVIHDGHEEAASGSDGQ